MAYDTPPDLGGAIEKMLDELPKVHTELLRSLED